MIPGIDVSHWQGEIDWSKVREAGVEFAYIKLTQGTETIDAMFERNWKGAKEAGILTGAYHFVSNSNIDRQIDLFLKHLPADTDLPPCFDFEMPEVNVEFFDPCRKAVPWMVLYTDPEWLEATFKIDRGVPLWIANYDVPKPRITPWSNWTFWQHSNSMSIPGMPDPEIDVDLDWFNGTIDDLKNLPKTGV